MKIIKQSVTSTDSNKKEGKIICNNTDNVIKKSKYNIEEDLPKLEKIEVLSYVFNDYIKANAKKYGLTIHKITSLIKIFTGVNIFINDNNDNKTVYLGCVEDEYYDYASKDKNGISFHIDKKWWDFNVAKYTTLGLWLVNYSFLNYVIYRKWKIVLVTDPSKHYNLDSYEKLTSRMYASELEVLCNYYKKNWCKDGEFWMIQSY